MREEEDEESRWGRGRGPVEGGGGTAFDEADLKQFSTGDTERENRNRTVRKKALISAEMWKTRTVRWEFGAKEPWNS